MTFEATQPTLIGRVRHVLGATITAELHPNVAGTTPLYRGRVYQIGQVGSLVCIPRASLLLVGSVSMIGIAELLPPSQPAIIPQQGERWIQFQLMGEIDGEGRFSRGVSHYPGIDDPVHFATQEQFRTIYPREGEGHLRLGTLAAARGDPLFIDLGKLVVRHGAIVGSTGSGKSSTVATLVQGVLAAGFNRANVVIIDPHGEHSTALGTSAAVLSISGTGATALSVPYWALSLDELIQVYSRGAERNPVTRNRLQELVLAERQEFLRAAKWPVPPADDITVDSPVPFDLRKVWYRLDFDNRATYDQANGRGPVCVEDPGDACSLTPARFEAYALGSARPFKGPTLGHYSPLPDRLRVRLTDPRFSFLCRAWPAPAEPDPLPECINLWLGGTAPVSILDFSGAPSEAADVAVGAILNLLFVAAANSSSSEGIGRSRPVLIILEEAHRFLGKSSATTGLAREAAERIAKEGRKYGVGLLLVSQRPSELSDTVLSQCGTIMAMRLTNESDQGAVRSTLPDASAALANILPSLRTGEVLVSGEAISLPARVVVDRPNPEPHAADPPISAWRGNSAVNDVRAAINRWRGAVKLGPESKEAN
jgi:hypothetical protein